MYAGVVHKVNKKVNDIYIYIYIYPKWSEYAVSLTCFKLHKINNFAYSFFWNVNAVPNLPLKQLASFTKHPGK